MSTVQEQIDARKKRLQQLSQLRNVDERSSNDNDFKNPVQVDSPKARTQIDSSQAVYSTDIKGKYPHDSYESLPHDRTEIMRNALKEPLDELDERTNKVIQRLVRQRLISDAVNQE